jgi:two-component system response regulator
MEAVNTLETRPDVLVVEDDEDEVRFIRRAIRRNGVESRFKILPNGEDALEYLEGRERTMPKLLVLDLDLPRLHGHEVLRRVRADERLRELPVVIVSSSRSDRDVRECYRLGANSFVPKSCGHKSPGEHILVIARYWLEFNRPIPAA